MRLRISKAPRGPRLGAIVVTLLLTLALLVHWPAAISVQANTAPSLISYTEVVWNTGAASKTTASISWNSGDVLVALSLAEGPTSVPGTPSNTGSGLTWADNQTQLVNSDCTGRVSTAVASATSSGTVTVTPTTATKDFGFGVWVWRGSDGVGTSAKLGGTPQTTKTQAVTPAGGADSGFVWGICDFNADGAYSGGTPTPSNTRQNAQIASHYTIGVFDLTDQTSAGSTSYGATGGGTTGPFLIFVQEVKGTAGGGGASSPKQLPLLGCCEAGR